MLRGPRIKHVCRSASSVLRTSVESLNECDNDGTFLFEFLFVLFFENNFVIRILRRFDKWLLFYRIEQTSAKKVSVGFRISFQLIVLEFFKIGDTVRPVDAASPFFIPYCSTRISTFILMMLREISVIDPLKLWKNFDFFKF